MEQENNTVFGSCVNSVGITLSYPLSLGSKCISVTVGRTSFYLHGTYKAMREFANAIQERVDKDTQAAREKLQKELDTLSTETLEEKKAKLLASLEEL